MASFSDQPGRLYIGIMTGTSMDGADAVLADIPDDYAGGPIVLHASVHVPIEAALKSQLMGLQSAGHNEIHQEALASIELARLYAECVEKLLSFAHVLPADVTAIGVHGQTVRHLPEHGYTRQINNGALLAELSGIDVIADFRSRDIAAGGQGAPLVPAFHDCVFHPEKNRTVVAVNIGGIANISLMKSGGDIRGWDTGPGNVLIDAWIKQNRGEPYDRQGNWAASGQCNDPLLHACLSEAYFDALPPKSTGRDRFNENWLNEKLAVDRTFLQLSPEDIQATLTHLTARSIADDIIQHAPDAEKIYLCGGGAFNDHLVMLIRTQLASSLPMCPVKSSTAVGIDPLHIESLAFAWLAHRFIMRKPANLPAVTGARGSRILGALYPAG